MVILFFSLRFFGPLFFPLSLVFFSLVFTFLNFLLLASVQSMEFWFWRVPSLFFFLSYFRLSYQSPVLVHGTISFTDTAAPFSSSSCPSSSASNYCYLNEKMQQQRQFWISHFLFLP